MVNNANAIIRNPKNIKQIIGCKADTKELVINGCDVTSIAEEAFAGNKELRSVKIHAFRLRDHNPRYIETIGRGTFAGCSNLSHVEIESDVAVFEESLFEGTAQKKVHVPESVAVLGRRCFANCAELEDVSGCLGVSVIEPMAFEGCEKLKRISLPAVRQIKDFAFEGCSSLKYLALPLSMRTLSDTFYFCDSLESITYEGSREDFVALFGGKLPISIPYWTPIACCDGLMKLDKLLLSKDRRGVAAANFYLRGVTVPSFVRRLHYCCFSDLPYLEEVTLPESISFISSSIFDGCSRLRRVVYKGTRAQWKSIDKQSDGDWLYGRTAPVTVCCSDGKMICVPKSAR